MKYSQDRQKASHVLEFIFGSDDSRRKALIVYKLREAAIRTSVSCRGCTYRNEKFL